MEEDGAWVGAGAGRGEMAKRDDEVSLSGYVRVTMHISTCCVHVLCVVCCATVTVLIIPSTLRFHCVDTLDCTVSPVVGSIMASSSSHNNVS